jgi:hypothetical protein
VSDLDDAISEASSAPASGSSLDQAVREIHTDAGVTPPSIRDLANDNFESSNATLKHLVKGAAGSVLGGYAGLTKLITSGGDMDQAAAAVNDMQSRFYDAPKTETEKKQRANLESPKNPLNWVPEAGSWLGDLEGKLGGGPGLQTAVETGVNAIPYALGLRPGEKPPMVDVSKLPTPTPEPPPAPGMAVVPSRGTAVARAPGSALPSENVIDVQARPVDTAGGPRLGGPGQRQITQAPGATTAEPPKGTQTPEPQKFLTFDQDAPHVEEGDKLPPDEQQRRADVLKRVGVEQARKSALTGDAQAAADEYQSSLLNTPGGQHLKSVIDHERNALETHADSIVNQTGGTEGSTTNQTANTQRGENFLKPLDALADHFDTVRKELYQTADERAKGQPIQLPTVDEFMRKNESAFIGSTAGTQLLKGLKARMGELGLVDGDGNMVGGTAQHAEQLRQYLNEQWEPGPKSRLIGKLKDAIDTDVTKSAGDDIYQKARAWRSLQARTLEDPKGIAQLLDSSGPDGVNRKVPVEQVMQKLTTMPVAQLRHIVTTLDGIDVPEIRPLADRAVAELNAHMASQVSDAGHSTASLWNQKGVNKYLNANSERLQLTMPPELQGKLKDLNDAGQILQKRQGYPGAYIQEHNMVSKGLGPAVRFGSELAGHAMGPIVGLGGRLLGDRAAGGIANAASLKAARARTVNLRDFNPNAK